MRDQAETGEAQQLPATWIDNCFEFSKHGTNKETVDKQVGGVDLKKREDAPVVKNVAPVSEVP